MVLTKMKRQQSHLLERQYQMQLLHVQHISMIHKDKPQRMPVQLPLNVMRIINEPTAVAIAYGLEREEIKKETL